MINSKQITSSFLSTFPSAIQLLGILSVEVTQKLNLTVIFIKPEFVFLINLLAFLGTIVINSVINYYLDNLYILSLRTKSETIIVKIIKRINKKIVPELNLENENQNKSYLYPPVIIHEWNKFLVFILILLVGVFVAITINSSYFINITTKEVIAFLQWFIYFLLIIVIGSSINIYLRNKDEKEKFDLLNKERSVRLLDMFTQNGFVKRPKFLTVVDSQSTNGNLTKTFKIEYNEKVYNVVTDWNTTEILTVESKDSPQ